MSSTVSFNGSTYIIPSTGEVGWGSNVSNYLIAIAAGALQKTGGSFTLSAEVDFGASFGLAAKYYKSRNFANPATTGVVRFSNDELGPTWRNTANNGDLGLSVSTSDQLTFNGTPIGGAGIFTASRAIVSDGSGNLTSATTTATEIGYVNGVTSAIQTQLNAKQSSSLTSAHIFVGNVSNVATDVTVSGDLTLTNTGNFQIAAGAIVNADINSAAAIAITKIANGTANQLIGANSGASANEFKTLSGTSNQVTVTNGVGTITLATPQSIDTAAAVQFGTLTLGGALDTSSILSLTSTTKGFLPPVMTTTQKNAISTPTNGLVVFDSSLAQLYLRTGGVWTPLSTGGGSGTVGSGTANQLAYYAGSGTTVSGLTSITASRALASDANGLPVASTTLATELAFVSGVTSAIQTQLNLKAPLASPTFTDPVTIADGGTGLIWTRATYDSYSWRQSGTGFNLRNVTDARTEIQLDQAGNVSFPGGKIGVGSSSTSAGVDIRGTSNFILMVPPDDLSPTSSAIELTNAAISVDNFVLQKNGLVKCAGVSFNSTSTQGIVGTTTNDSAAAGFVGEVARSQTNGVNLTTSGANYVDALTLALTAGDWDISVSSVGFSTGTTFTAFSVGIGTTSGNNNTGTVLGDNYVYWFSEGATGLVGGKGPSLCIPSYRVSISGTTTYYIKAQGVYTGTVPQFIGRVSARRVR